MTLSTLLILEVRKTHVIHEPSILPGPPRVSRSSLVRAFDRSAEGQRFESPRELRVFLVVKEGFLLMDSQQNNLII